MSDNEYLGEAPSFEDRANNHQALYVAAHALYSAGRWTCDRAVDAAGLWTALRDALGLPPGTATKLGMGQPKCETVTLELKVDGEAFRQALNELDRLQGRVGELLAANNREVERRRGAERLLRGAASLFRKYEAHHEAKVPGLMGIKRDEVKEKIIRNASAAAEIETFLAGENA